MTMLSDGMLMGAVGDTAKEFVSSARGFQANPSQNATTPKPAGVLNGDLLVVVLSGLSDISNATISGWTRVINGTRIVVFTRIADGTEPSTITVTQTSSYKSAYALCYRGVTGFDIAGSVGSGSSAAPSAPSVSTTKSGVLLAVFVGDSSANVTPPAGMAMREMYSSLAGAVCDLIPSPVGASGGKTASLDSSTGWAAQLFQIY